MSKLRVDKIAAPIVQDEFTGSVYFTDPGNEYLSIANNNSDFVFGTGDFTIEGWFYINSSGSNNSVYDFRDDSGFEHYVLRMTSSTEYDFRYLGTSLGTFTAASSTWNHIAVARQSGITKIFVNGVQTNSFSDTNNASNDEPILIGTFSNTKSSSDSKGFNGYVSNFRVCKGHAVYTGNFTVPTRELLVHTAPPKGVVFPAADNITTVLACQSSTDATLDSSGRHTITANGDVHAQSANPGLFRRTLNLTTVTENTGSVFFDGTGDYLKIGTSTDFSYGNDDFTVESWIYPTALNTVNTIVANWDLSYGNNEWGYYLNSSNKIKVDTGTSNVLTSVTSVNLNVWTHVVYTRQSGTHKLYINGVLDVSSSTVYDYSEVNPLGIGGYSNAGENPFTGYISNVRICKGHAVYTKQFTPPTRELEVHGGPEDNRTVLLACYDGENIFADKSGRHIIAAYGDRTSSPTPTATDSPIGITTHNPGLTRNVDPTDGPTFQGGAGFVSQNWLTLPKGTTTDRMPVFGGVNATSARGVFGGGYSTSDIEYIQISTLGNSSEFGDRAHADFARPASLSSSTRGLFAGGFKPSSYTNAIDYITITSTGNGKDFGDMSIAVWSRAGCSNSIRGILAGGFASSNFNVIEHLTIATTGNTQDFGDLTRSRREKGGSSSTTRGIFMGGRSPVPSGVNNDEDIIDYITIASTGNAVDFGNLAADRSAGASCSNATRSLYSGGNSSNAIEFVTIATLGNAVDFGDMSNALNRLGSCASSTRGIIAGGSPTNNTIEYVTIATAGDAQDFGDLNAGAKRDIAGLSNGHGGLG